MFTLNEVIFTLFYNERTKDEVFIVMTRFFFYFIPTYTFSVLFGGITRKCGTHLSMENMGWV